MHLLVEKCALRREELPKIDCDCIKCPWFIRDPTSKNCFWVLGQELHDFPGSGLSFEEIAVLEGITVEEAKNIFEAALSKVREYCSLQSVEVEYANEET